MDALTAPPRHDPDGPVPLYAARAAGGVAGITYRQLDHWASHGYITVTVDADGSGSRRLLSPDDVARICRIVQLRDLGVELRVAIDPPPQLAALVDEHDVACCIAALQHLPVEAYLVDGQAQPAMDGPGL
jgi:hypothetical protein